MSNEAHFPYLFLPDPSKGRPLFNASLYFGIPDLDPEILANQVDVQVIQEDGTVVSVAQPIETGAGGVPLYNGSPVQVCVSQGSYSLKILDRQGSQVYYFPEVKAKANVGDSSRIFAELNSGSGEDAFSDEGLFLGQFVRTSGYSSSNDGGGNLYIMVASGTGTPDGGQYIDHPTLPLQFWGQFPSGEVYAEQFGAKADASADASSAIQSALNYSQVINIGAGSFLLLDGVTVPVNGRIKGAARHSTFLMVDDTFNMSASGVLIIQENGEPGAEISDLSIIFEQPDTDIKANLNQYPPAFYAVDAPRFNLHRIRVELAWDGINMTGNSGGSNIDDFEISAFNIDIDIDGSFDSIKITRLHAWPFGLTLRPLLYSIYESADHTALRSGRCDDFHLDNSIFFSLPIATNFYLSSGGSTFGSISQTDFDDRGGLNVSAGSLALNGCYFTIGKTDAVIANITGGTVSINGCHMSYIAIPNGGIGITTTGSSTQVVINGGAVGCENLDFTHAVADNGATFIFNNVTINRSPNIAYTQPTLRWIGTAVSGACVGNTMSAIGTGSGTFVNLNSDSNVTIEANTENGWGYSFPAGATSNIQASFAGILGTSVANVTPNGSGIATFSHGLPIRPSGFTAQATGSGGFIHIQPVSQDDTNLSVYVTDDTGTPIVSMIGLRWVAFL